MAKTYYEEFNIANAQKLEALLTELPEFTEEFFVGIAMRTSVLTRINYATDLKIFFDYLIRRVRKFKDVSAVSDFTLSHLNQVQKRDIEAFLVALEAYDFNGKILKNTEKGKARKLSSVRSMFKYFYNNEELDENVASKVSMPKLHDKEIIRLDDEEVVRLLDNAEREEKFDTKHQNTYNLNTRDRDIALITLLVGTGIRVSECVGLNIDDIDLEKNAFVVTRKGGNRSVLYFSDEVNDALSIYLPTRAARLKKAGIDDEPALFLSLQNRRITVRAVENVVKKMTRTVNPLKSVSPHKLRSTYGTALYRKTKDIYVVAEVLGHRDVNTTKKHYAAISEDIKRSAAKQVVLREEKD